MHMPHADTEVGMMGPLGSEGKGSRLEAGDQLLERFGTQPPACPAARQPAAYQPLDSRAEEIQKADDRSRGSQAAGTPRIPCAVRADADPLRKVPTVTWLGAVTIPVIMPRRVIQPPAECRISSWVTKGRDEEVDAREDAPTIDSRHEVSRPAHETVATLHEAIPSVEGHRSLVVRVDLEMDRSYAACPTTFRRMLDRQPSDSLSAKSRQQVQLVDEGIAAMELKAEAPGDHDVAGDAALAFDDPGLAERGIGEKLAHRSFGAIRMEGRGAILARQGADQAHEDRDVVFRGGAKVDLTHARTLSRAGGVPQTQVGNMAGGCKG
jgi:hypothetical protein